MTDDYEIDIRREGEITLICGMCGMTRRMPQGWRPMLGLAPDEPLRCVSGHAESPMHAFVGMEHPAGGAYRGRCECGHVGAWHDKDTAWLELAAHMKGPLEAAILRNVPVRPGTPGSREVPVTRLICVHQQFSSDPCPHGCHDHVIRPTTDGQGNTAWAPRRGH